MEKIKRFIKNYKYSVPTAIILIIIVLIFLSTRGGNKVKAETIDASRATVSQEVSVTGRVVPSESVDLAIQAGGKVTSIPVKVGNKVTEGQTLLRVDSADLQIRLGKQQAALQKAQLALSKQDPKATAEDTLRKAYEDGFNTLADSYVDIPTIVTELDQILYKSGYSNYLSSTNLRSLSQTAADNRTNIGVRFDRAQDTYEVVNRKYGSFNRNASAQELNSMLSDTHSLLTNLSDIVKDLRNLVKYVKDNTNEPRATEIDRDLTTLDSYISDINTHLAALSAVQATIKDAQKGITDQSSDIESSQIDIRQAQLDIQDTIVQINNRTIKAPANGIVTDVKAKVGETISPGSPIVSIISADQYEIEANIPEADMAKVVVGAETEVTLDAYGSDVIFKARVISVNPAETLVDGVATYKTKFQFVDNDERIKSGMTASLIIKGETKDNVIAIPQRSVITRGQEKLVQILDGEKIVEKKVQTGLRGSDGSIEIVSGIAEGEKVVVFNEQ
jgi:RND family efflux transporter MFP subunit